MEDLTITGYSTALFSTWIFIPEMGILFDAGDGVSSSLLQKGRKVKHILISHADRDHLGGLFQFTQLNSRLDFPKIYYPKDCGSFPAMKNFLSKFDTQTKQMEWIPISEKTNMDLTAQISFRTYRNSHIKISRDIIKSLSYLIEINKNKLKSEFKNLSKDEIINLSKVSGKEFITENVKEKLIGYTGDTPVENLEKWNNTKILIHESTFLNKEDLDGKRWNLHSSLEGLLEQIKNIKIEKLILTHFSSRYSKKEIDESIRKYSKKYNIDIPIYRIPPGEIIRNVLKSEIINQ